jgi:acyl-CoA-binding protein
LYNLSKDEVVDLFLKKAIKSMNHRLTIYSLFKQTEEGDCPFNNDAPVSDPIKQKVWA